jgi:homoserine dehydrogenase
MHMRLATIGFGNVGRALAIMLAEKADELMSRYQLAFSWTGSLTRSAGGWIAPQGIAVRELAAGDWPSGAAPRQSWPIRGHVAEFITACPADILIELTTLDPVAGQPATDHIRAALQAGRHVVTCNKGPIAYAYHQLQALAAEKDLALRFESTVIDGTPIFNMVDSSLPVTTISGFRGLLNSTSNYVLDCMAAGETLEVALEAARRVGVAEADPGSDLEGWDAAVKATILANVLMGAKLRPADVARLGLGPESMRREMSRLQPGQTLKQVVECVGDSESVRAWVRLEALPPEDLLAHLSGTQSALILRTDTMQDLAIIPGAGGPEQTAFGIVADLVSIARSLDQAR